jgi:hypothetical protein
MNTGAQLLTLPATLKDCAEPSFIHAVLFLVCSLPLHQNKAKRRNNGNGKKTLHSQSYIKVLQVYSLEK